MFTDVTWEKAAILISAHAGVYGNSSEDKFENRKASKAYNFTSILIDSSKTKHTNALGPKAVIALTNHHKNISSEKVTDCAPSEADCVHKDGVNTTTSLDWDTDEHYALTFSSSVALVAL